MTTSRPAGPVSGGLGFPAGLFSLKAQVSKSHVRRIPSPSRKSRYGPRGKRGNCSGKYQENRGIRRTQEKESRNHFDPRWIEMEFRSQPLFVSKKSPTSRKKHSRPKKDRTTPVCHFTTLYTKDIALPMLLFSRFFLNSGKIPS